MTTAKNDFRHATIVGLLFMMKHTTAQFLRFKTFCTLANFFLYHGSATQSYKHKNLLCLDNGYQEIKLHHSGTTAHRRNSSNRLNVCKILSGAEKGVVKDLDRRVSVANSSFECLSDEDFQACNNNWPRRSPNVIDRTSHFVSSIALKQGVAQSADSLMIIADKLEPLQNKIFDGFMRQNNGGVLTAISVTIIAQNFLLT